MKAMFSSQGIWDLVENGFHEPVHATTYNTLPKIERDLLSENSNKDEKSLFYIFQVVHEIIF